MRCALVCDIKSVDLMIELNNVDWDFCAVCHRGDVARRVYSQVSLHTG